MIVERGHERTWLVGGGDLAGQLLAADLLDELILTVAPTLVGNGPALADGEFPLRRFTPTRLERFGDDGVRCITSARTADLAGPRGDERVAWGSPVKEDRCWPNSRTSCFAATSSSSPSRS